MDRYKVFPSGELGMSPTGNWTPYADAQATVEALQRERDEYARMWRDGCNDRGAAHKEIEDLTAALDAEREKVKAIEKVLDIDSGKTTVEKVVDLKRSFAQVWESYQDAANEMFEAQAQLSQLKALVRALPVVEGPVKDEDILDNWESDRITFEALRGLLEYRATLDATTPATMDAAETHDRMFNHADRHPEAL